MVSLANRSRPFSSGLHRTYRIEMGGRTLLVSLGLALLTGLVVFYMGVVAGEGSRTPIVATVPVQSAAPGDSAALPQADPDQLAFNRSLMKETPMVEDLWESQEQAAQQTRDILARAQRELTVEEVAMPTAAPAIRDAARPERANTPPAAQAPREAPAPPPARAAAAPPATDVDPRYTVQVFSSRNRESAEWYFSTNASIRPGWLDHDEMNWTCIPDAEHPSKASLKDLKYLSVLHLLYWGARHRARTFSTPSSFICLTPSRI